MTILSKSRSDPHSPSSEPPSVPKDNSAESAPASAEGVIYLEGSRGASLRKLWRVLQGSTALILFIAIVAMPVAVSSIYFGFIAADRYVSHAALTVRQPNGATPDPLSGMLMQFTGQNTSKDSYIVRNFIESRTIVNDLEEWIGFSRLFKLDRADWLSRLSEEANREELYEYYRNRVDVSFDQQTGVVDLRVEAFNADDAKTIADAVVALSDDMVNQVSERSRQEAVRFAEIETRQARERLEEARLKVAQFRRQYGEIDPVQAAVNIGQIVGSIEAEIATARTEIAQLRSYLDEGSPQVTALRARIKALEGQLAEEKARLASASTDKTYARLLDDYERLRMEEEFARNVYSSALGAAEMARADAKRRQLYLVAFVEPSVPDYATEPKRMWLIASTLGLCLLGYGIVMLIIAAIREHTRL